MHSSSTSHPEAVRRFPVSSGSDAGAHAERDRDGRNPRDWNISLVTRLNSGLPYTPQLLDETLYLVPNSGRKPSQVTVDLLADKTFVVAGINLTAFLKVFNLFDTLNERFVYDDTGRATYSLSSKLGPALYTDQLAEQIPGVHSAREYFVRPTYYGPPREVRVGLSLEF